MKRAVITGMGAITPLGNQVKEFWLNLKKGTSGAAKITKFDTSNFKTQFACEVKDFDPLTIADKKEVRKLDDYTLYALAAAKECIDDSEIDLNQTDLTKAGVILATGIGGIHTFEKEMLLYDAENPRFNPFFITKMISNIAAGQISIRYGLKGISYSVSSACASANNAIGNALDLIRMGRATVLLAGGSEATISPAAIGGFNAMKALSTNNDSPASASRPFDITRDGFVAGEGAGILMIEEMEHALARGAKIYCELAGYGASSDAYHVAASHPEGEGAIQAMKEAINDAGLTTADIDHINAHATSTPVGDISECKAIESLFEDNLKNIAISATKSMTGHLLGAAGAIESIACIKAIEEGILPPTINFNELDPKINTDLNLILNKAVEKEIKAALNNTFGFGGHTSSTLFKKYIQ